jgi:hypothetical protein
MNAFRAKVAAILDGSAPPPVLVPGAEPAGAGSKERATLRRGSTGDSVKELQQFLGLVPDGSFGPRTEAAMRAVQRSLGMVPDGIVGPKTWAALDQAARANVRAAAASAVAPPAASDPDNDNRGAAMADELPPLSMADLAAAMANPNFKSYVYIGDTADRQWTFAKKAQQMLAGLRVYRASPQGFGAQVRSLFGVGPGVVGVICGFDGKMKRQLSPAEADDFLTVAEAVANA